MRKDFGPVFWLHALLLIPAYLSPILVDYRLIIVGVIILQIQYWITGGCFLTHWEMGPDNNETFMWYYLKKWYPKLDPKKTKFVIRVVVPGALIIFGILLQVIYTFQPLLF